MTSVVEKVAHSQDELHEPKAEERLYRVFIGFRKPRGFISIFFEGNYAGCGVYESLGKVFKRPPQEIYESIFRLLSQGGNGFMQEYLSLDDASFAVAQASLFANTSECTCFLEQQAYFYITETK